MNLSAAVLIAVQS